MKTSLQNYIYNRPSMLIFINANQ